MLAEKWIASLYDTSCPSSCADRTRGHRGLGSPDHVCTHRATQCHVVQGECLVPRGGAKVTDTTVVYIDLRPIVVHASVEDQSFTGMPSKASHTPHLGVAWQKIVSRSGRQQQVARGSEAR